MPNICLPVFHSLFLQLPYFFLSLCLTLPPTTHFRFFCLTIGFRAALIFLSTLPQSFVPLPLDQSQIYNYRQSFCSFTYFFYFPFLLPSHSDLSILYLMTCRLIAIKLSFVSLLHAKIYLQATAFRRLSERLSDEQFVLNSMYYCICMCARRKE